MAIGIISNQISTIKLYIKHSAKFFGCLFWLGLAHKHTFNTMHTRNWVQIVLYTHPFQYLHSFIGPSAYARPPHSNLLALCEFCALLASACCVCACVFFLCLFACLTITNSNTGCIVIQKAEQSERSFVRLKSTHSSKNIIWCTHYTIKSQVAINFLFFSLIRWSRAFLFLLCGNVLLALTLTHSAHKRYSRTLNET